MTRTQKELAMIASGLSVPQYAPPTKAAATRSAPALQDASMQQEIVPLGCLAVTPISTLLATMQNVGTPTTSSCGMETLSSGPAGTETRANSEMSLFATLYPVTQTARRRLLGMISTEEWRHIEELASGCFRSSMWVRGELKLLIEMGEVEVGRFPQLNRSESILYRGVATGFLAQYYSTPSLNTRLLAECWGGYSYREQH